MMRKMECFDLIFISTTHKIKMQNGVISFHFSSFLSATFAHRYGKEIKNKGFHLHFSVLMIVLVLDRRCTLTCTLLKCNNFDRMCVRKRVFLFFYCCCCCCCIFLKPSELCVLSSSLTPDLYRRCTVAARNSGMCDEWTRQQYWC